MNRIGSFLHCIRLTSLITTIVIVIGSLFLYSSNATPLDISETKNSKTWMIQSITDRRLISTLVAAQASIFCPLFILLSPSNADKETESCMIEIICQWLMPLGLALSWIFSILFDLKTTYLIGQNSLCLSQDAGCILFGFIYALKYAIVLLFVTEAALVTLKSIAKNQIQLPTDEEEQKI